MYINSEKTMEDYLSNDKKFKGAILSAFGLTSVRYIGRQLHIGTENIIDMLYIGNSGEPESDDFNRYLIIVELKYRALEAKDYSQLGRYIFATNQFFKQGGESEEYKDVYVVGLLVGTGITRECADLLNGDFFNLDTIKTMIINTVVDYEDVTNSLFSTNGCNGIVETEFKKLKECLLIKKTEDEGTDEHGN